MTIAKTVPSNDTVALLNQRLVEQAKDANSTSGLWAAIGIH